LVGGILKIILTYGNTESNSHNDISGIGVAKRRRGNGNSGDY